MNDRKNRDKNSLKNSTQKSLIDYLTFNIDFTYEMTKKTIINHLKLVLGKSELKLLSANVDKTYYGYKTIYKIITNDSLKSSCGVIQLDQTKKKLKIELTGKACLYINQHNMFKNIQEIGNKYTAQITRLDIAVDDITGKYTDKSFRTDFKAGKFIPPRGQGPKIDKMFPLAIYIGSINSEKRFVAYYKFDGFRIEIRFKCSQRYNVSFDELSYPDVLFVGAYPKVLKKVIKGVEPRCIKREVLKSFDNTLKDKIAYAKHQVGPTVDMAVKRGLADSEIVNAIHRVSSRQVTGFPNFITTEDLNQTPFHCES